MSVAAFCVLAVLLGGYVLLDGYDLGLGIIVLFIARNDEERAAARQSIAPFWNGNETLLIGAGAALFAFFPLVYASSFSGFYLPFIVVLWLFMGRGIAFEIREMVDHALWHAFWDVVFAFSSLALVFFFGITLGNIIRGVPLEQGGYFLGLFGFLFNGYALGVALLAVLTLSLHGAVYVLSRTPGRVAARSGSAAHRLLTASAACWFLVSAATFFVRSPATFGSPVAIGVGAALGIASLVALRVLLQRNRQREAFFASSGFLAGMLLAAAGTIFPYLLPGFPIPSKGLDVYSSAPSSAALTTTLVVTILGLVLFGGYRTFLARRFSH